MPNFKTFDFYDEATGLATSAKTLDTTAISYVRDPRRVFVVIKRYIDDMRTFKYHARGEYDLNEAIIQRRSLQLAVPAPISNRQVQEINRARIYAESFGIVMEVSFIE